MLQKHRMLIIDHQLGTEQSFAKRAWSEWPKFILLLMLTSKKQQQQQDNSCARFLLIWELPLAS